MLAALEALGDPFGLGGAIGGENQVADGFAQDLGGGVAEHALKFLIDTLRAEGSVGNDERVGRVLEELFEILAADAEGFFRAGFLWILLFGICFSGIYGVLFQGTPGERRWLFDGVGDHWRNEGGRGSALERLMQTLGAYEFP